VHGTIRIGITGATAIGLSAAAVGIDTTPTWNPSVVVDAVLNYFTDFPVYEGQNRYLAYDHFGEPGIAYSNGGFIHYARPIAGLGWVVEAMDDPDAYSVLGQPSLAFGLDEMPHVVWSGSTVGFFTVVYHAFFDGMAWTFDFFAFGDERPPEQLTGAVSIDLLGRPAAAYTLDGVVLYYRSDTDGDGLLLQEQDCVLSIGSGSVEMSTAFDAFGQAMAAFATFDVLVFAARPLGHECFSGEIIANDARYPSLAVDPDTGYPAIAYYDSANQNLVYAEWDGGQWAATNIDTAGVTGLWPSLAFDPSDGNPAIAYQSQTGGDLMFAWHDGVQWNTQVAVNGTLEVPTGYTPSLAFNDFGTGFPAIAYFGIDSNLHFVEDPPKLGDLDGDAVVGILDFLIMIGDWGETDSPADLDGNGTVGIEDFLILLENWG
jgi:hypothetical protein